ncbi:putative ATP-dependent RNA helicase DHX33, partial [Eschrichtius robustus]|nr:putative ATP-dependent RNA helicase DHX33 [Eschrichtius robustus]
MSGVSTQVGYTVRFDDVTSEDTKIKFLTDGMLLREAISDSLLRKYSCVILDEAHERTIHTDVLFGVVKAAQKRRKELGKLPLKVIVMSATMDVDLFSQYFSGAPVLYLEGRQHPIQIFYTKQPQHDYLHAALVSVFQIHQGCRKVIISTNIAETSITITGIKYVVDTGMVKAKKYNPGTTVQQSGPERHKGSLVFRAMLLIVHVVEFVHVMSEALTRAVLPPDSGLEVLAVQRVSKTQAWQRTGRAGREDSGVCYRLYTEDEFEKFEKMTVPEIQRCNLTSVTLQLLAMKVPDVLTFDFMSKPSP